jgi:tRNA(Ile)-lysidine synthase
LKHRSQPGRNNRGKKPTPIAYTACLNVQTRDCKGAGAFSFCLPLPHWFHFKEVCDRSDKMPIKEKPARPALECQVRGTIQKYEMLKPGDHVVVAASGGADSTALLLCLNAFGWEFNLSLTVAHLNHRIRAAEADADEEFVRKLAARMGLPFISETADVKREAAASGSNLEELARRKRYEFLRRTASQVKAQKIAVGHTMNDQAETALFRFIRGSGLEGLSAIYPVVDGVVIRPLLECTRKSVEEYLEFKCAAYREDSSNLDVRHARNRIRHELIPYLEKNFNPKLMPTLSREALINREAWAYIEFQTKQAFDAVSRRSEEGMSLAVPDLLRLHPALQKEVLRHAVRECSGSLRGITAKNIDDLLLLCRGGMSGRQVRLHGFAAFREFDNLLLRSPEPSGVAGYCYVLEIPGACRVPENGSVFISSVREPPLDRIRLERWTRAFFEPAALPEFLTIRSRLPGDRYGGPGHRKVKRMLIDKKIPLGRRSVLPMVAAGRDVIWIPGFRPARAYESPPGSEGCVMIEVQSMETTDSDDK